MHHLIKSKNKGYPAPKNDSLIGLHQRDGEILSFLLKKF